jgi:hypothetical protein
MPMRINITVVVFFLSDADVSECLIALNARNPPKDSSNRLYRNVGKFLILSLFSAVYQFTTFVPISVQQLKYNSL